MYTIIAYIVGGVILLCLFIRGVIWVINTVIKDNKREQLHILKKQQLEYYLRTRDDSVIPVIDELQRQMDDL